MAARHNAGWVIGIDEVGRGALAGPVTVAAAILPANSFHSLKDSKKLSAAQREFFAKELAGRTGVRSAVARVYPRGIERLNISAAANLAAARSLSRLLKDHKLPAGTSIYLDGGLYLGSKVRQQDAVKNGHMRAKTVIKADEKFPAVAAASIIAKVSRDRFMTRLARRYPAYGFEVHKGYGTAVHRRAIKKFGPCDAHRLTFLGKRPIIDR